MGTTLGTKSRVMKNKADICGEAHESVPPAVGAALVVSTDVSEETKSHPAVSLLCDLGVVTARRYCDSPMIWMLFLSIIRPLPSAS